VVLAAELGLPEGVVVLVGFGQQRQHRVRVAVVVDGDHDEVRGGDGGIPRRPSNTFEAEAAACGRSRHDNRRV